MQTWETYYKVVYKIDISASELDDILLEKRNQCKSFHFQMGALIDEWFEFEMIVNPMHKTTIGSILGRQEGGKGSENEVMAQMKVMMDKASQLPNFKQYVE